MCIRDRPYAGQPPIPLSVPVETEEDMRGQTAADHENTAGGVGLLTPEGPAVDAEEEAFIRAMQRKRKKKRRKGLGVSRPTPTAVFSRCV